MLNLLLLIRCIVALRGASLIALCALLLVGSAGHSSWLYVIVLIGDCCFVVGWACLVGVGISIGVGFDDAVFNVFFFILI